MIDVTTLAALAAVDTSTGVAAAYVLGNDAFYRFDDTATTTADEWVVVAPDVGSGRWILNGQRLTVPAQGSGLNDTPNLVAAGNALAAYGKIMCLRGEVYTLATQWAFPAGAALQVELDPLTELNSTIGVPIGNPSNAALYCAPGTEDRSTTVSAANVRFGNKIVIGAAVSAGEMIRVRNTVTGSGFRGNRYIVLSATPSGLDYEVTVDRPVINQFGEGDEVYIWASPRAIGHRISGNGALVTGNGDRLIEFICTAGCRIEGLRLRPSEVGVCGSFDLNGYDNHWINCEADGTLGIAEDGFWLETQEGSTIIGCRAHGIAAASSGTGAGIRLLNSEFCRVDAVSRNNDFGAVIWGEGGTDNLGSRNIDLRGDFSGNAVQGIAIGIGSSNLSIEAMANYNPVNLWIGDCTGVTYSGNFSTAWNTGIAGQGIGVLITAEAADAIGVVVDTSDSDTGISNASSSSSVVKHIHRGSVAVSRACLVNTGQAILHEVNYRLDTSNATLVRTSGTGRTDILSGNMSAGSGSVGLNLANTATGSLGALTMNAASGTGASVASGATLYVMRETDFAGMPIPFAGTGTILRPVTTLSRAVGPSSNSGATEEVLKSYTIAATALSSGTKVRISAAGQLAANANSKTVRLKFGGNTLGTITGGNGDAWSIEVDIYVTSLTTETYDLQAVNGAAVQAAAGTLGVDVTASPTIQLTAEGVTAGDITCDVLEIVRT